MTDSILPRMNTSLLRCMALLAAGCLLLNAGCASTAPKEHSQVRRSTRSVGSSSSSSSAPLSENLAHSFEDAVARGDDAWSANQTDMAVYFYVQALSFRPRDVTTLGKLGTLEQTRGDLRLAARAFDLAANENPSDARLTGRLGLIQMALGEQESAWKWLRLSVDTGNTDWRVPDQLSVVENRQGHYVDAVQYAQEAVALAPGAALPLLDLGQALYGSGNYVSAEDAARTTLHIANTPEAWQLLAQIQARRRAYSSSVDSLLQSMDAASAYNTAGKLAMENGDNAVALRYFDKASSVSPVYLTEAHTNAAIARERLTPTSTH
jgi:tetratricopeptide (TPR) repeat protein